MNVLIAQQTLAVHDGGSHNTALLHRLPIVDNYLFALLDNTELAFMACELYRQRAWLHVLRANHRLLGSGYGQRHVCIAEGFLDGRDSADRSGPSAAAVISHSLRH